MQTRSKVHAKSKVQNENTQTNNTKSFLGPRRRKSVVMTTIWIEFSPKKTKQNIYHGDSRWTFPQSGAAQTVSSAVFYHDHLLPVTYLNNGSRDVSKSLRWRGRQSKESTCKQNKLARRNGTWFTWGLEPYLGKQHFDHGKAQNSYDPPGLDIIKRDCRLQFIRLKCKFTHQTRERVTLHRHPAYF